MSEDLSGRVREALSGREPREVRMFGGLAFMVRGAMVACTRPGGALLVRVDPERSAELLARPGAAQAEMGEGRSMGPSWIGVESGSVAGDADLRFWLDAALDFNRVKARS